MGQKNFSPTNEQIIIAMLRQLSDDVNATRAELTHHITGKDKILLLESYKIVSNLNFHAHLKKLCNENSN